MIGDMGRGSSAKKSADPAGTVTFLARAPFLNLTPG